MNYLTSPPLSHETATTFVKKLQLTWNDGDAAEMAEVFSQDCEWRDNSRQLQGKDEIQEYLQSRIQEQLHFQVKAELWSHSFFRLAVSFQSEWQNATKGKWYRASGHIFIRLDNIGGIKEFCLSTSDTAISVNQRTHGIFPQE